MLVKNVRIEQAAETTDLRIRDGVIAEISPGLVPEEGERTLDGLGGLSLPPYVDSHVHLDTCLSLPKTGANVAGTLFEGIKLWSNYRTKIDKAELKGRAGETLALYINNGVQFVRSHVDITHDLLALEALLELREENRHLVHIQLAAFPQDGIIGTPGAKDRLEEAMKMGVDAIGAIPHFELTREYGLESIAFALNLAEKTGKPVDAHCDETDDEQSRFIEALAAGAYERRLGDRVSASHATAMHSYNSAYCAKLYRLLGMSGINVIANPLVNVTLQGRFDTYPKRRGITRVKELLDAGVNVSFGHDDIADPFYPLGDGNMLEVLFMGLHLCQMMGHDELFDSYRMVTHNGAKTLNLTGDYGIEVGKPANLIVLEAPDFITALRQRSRVAISVRGGAVIKE